MSEALHRGFAYQYYKAAKAPEYAADLEVEIYLRTDEDGYVVGYVALQHLIRHRDTLRQYGSFIVRTGRLRRVGEAVGTVPASA